MKQATHVSLWKKLLLILVFLFLTAGIGITAYIHDYYHADPAAMESLSSKTDGITVTRTDQEQIVVSPSHPSAGIIFYPGGKVQYEAYTPLMEAFASHGYLCVLVHMPANLAVLNSNAADGIQEQYPEISHWYMGAHSLGGVMAASYISKHADAYDGLILLASYSTADLSNSNLAVLSVYGSEDGVLKMDSYKKYRSNLPKDFTEQVIPGGCHAYFGCYGTQDGDGTPTITNAEQIRFTADAVAGFIG